MNDTKIEVEYLLIEGLKPSEYNPRKLSKKEYHKLKASILKFGMVDPIIVNMHPDRANVIVGGHQRYYICKELGHLKIPCVFVNLNLNDEQELNIRLNKNLGEWDYNMLGNINESILRDSGFEQKDLDKIFELNDDISEPSVEFTKELLEENNYVLFVFDNTMDWQVIRDRFGLKTVLALDSKEGYERPGIGRVVDGKKLLDIIQKHGEN